MKAQGTPGGMALGHASGDGNAWVHWCLWAFPAATWSTRPTRSSSTRRRPPRRSNTPSRCMRPSFPAPHRGTTLSTTRRSWRVRSTGPTTASRSTRRRGATPTQSGDGDDIDHAYWPVGPVGKPTEFHLCFPLLGMTYSKYPQACKALMAFMLEADNFNKWLDGSVGYLSHTLTAYDANPVWTADPKRTPFRDVAKRTLTAGHLGSIGEKAAAAIADFLGARHVRLNQLHRPRGREGCHGGSGAPGASAVSLRSRSRVNADD